MPDAALYAAIGILALLTAAGIRVAMGRAREQLDRLTDPDPYDWPPAPDSEGERRAIVVNPGREAL